MIPTEVERVVLNALLDRSDLIQRLGDKPLHLLQLRWSAERAHDSNLPRLIWMPAEAEIVDERQRAFIRQVQEGPEFLVTAELFEGNLTLLKKDLILKLSPVEKLPAVPPADIAPLGPPKVYLICEPQDERAVEPLEDFLFAQGLEVCLPALDGDSADASTLHRDNLLSCDGVLVFYGSAPRAWVEIKLRDTLKAAGYGRVKPIAIQGVYIAPPTDHRKERFKSHNTHIIHQPPEFAASDELRAFVQALKQVRT